MLCSELEKFVCLVRFNPIPEAKVKLVVDETIAQVKARAVADMKAKDLA